MSLLVMSLLAVACASPATGPAHWEQRLAGSTIALLGEIHDNAAGQQMRLADLQRAIDRGWRPVIVMEQFDVDRQALIERARSERPRDAAHLTKLAGGSSWDWPLYLPLLQLAFDHDLKLVAANLPSPLARRLVNEEFVAVLGPERTRQLGLDTPLPAQLQSVQQQEIDRGHCGALPAKLLPGMVRAQSARDAVFAELLARHRAAGAVLIAGNGHVRSDIGVPRWLRDRQQIAATDIIAVGYLESADSPSAPGFDAVVVVPEKTDRLDPCLQFKPR